MNWPPDWVNVTGTVRQNSILVSDTYFIFLNKYLYVIIKAEKKIQAFT